MKKIIKCILRSSSIDDTKSDNGDECHYLSPIVSDKKIPPPVPAKSAKVQKMFNDMKSKVDNRPPDKIQVNNRETVKYKMCDEEALEKLKMISTDGDPLKIYKLKARLGAG